MALIKRISRLFTADMHAVLDQLEEPESVLKQAIREMEEELARQEHRSKQLGKEIESAAGRLEALEELQSELDGKLDTCFEHGNDALARKLTRRKLETRKLAEHIEKRRAALREAHAESEATITANRDQLDSLRQKAELVAVERAGYVSSCSDDSVHRVDDDEVEIAFLREKQARETS